MSEVANSEATNGGTCRHTKNSTIDSLILKDEELVILTKRSQDNCTENSEHSTTEPMKSPSINQSSIEIPPNKKSRKHQGVGIKKPLYSKYESLFIIKAYQKILQRLPNLILIDIFRIISILFNKESIVKGFKKRTSDQLYQKYKRIQHGLNHGETGSDQLEFRKFFKRNEFNSKEWLPLDFGSSEFNNGTEDEDRQILKSIQLEDLEEAIDEILNSNNKTSEDVNDKFKEETDDDLLELDGYKDNRPADMEKTIGLMEQRIDFQQKEIKSLQHTIDSKDQEILFLKNMIKEDLSYIRVKVTDK